MAALDARQLPYVRPPAGEPILPGDTVEGVAVGAFGFDARGEDADEQDDVVFWDWFRNRRDIPPDVPLVSLADLHKRLVTDPDFLGRLGDIVLEPPCQVEKASAISSSLGGAFDRLLGPTGPATYRHEDEEVPLVPLIINAVEERGHLIWIVGGAVRDTILEREVKDVDLAGTMPSGAFCATVRKALANYEVAGYAIRPMVNPSSHVCRLIRDDLPDVPENRLLEYKPLVARGFPLPASGCSLADDVATRDLTVNSLFYYRKHHLVLDPSGEGLADLHGFRLQTPNKQEEALERANVAFRGLKLLLNWQDAHYIVDTSLFQQWLENLPSTTSADLERDCEKLAQRYRISLGKYPEARVDKIVASLGASAVALVELARKGDPR